MANACYKDAADLHADLEDYPQAVARYEQVADHSLGSALTKYSVKEYWMRASLCCLAMGVSVFHLRLRTRNMLKFVTGYCHSEAEFAAVLDLGQYLRVYPGGQVYYHPRRCGGEWRSGGVHWRRRRVRPGNAAGQLEDGYAFESEEDDPGGAAFDLDCTEYARSL